MGLFSSSQNCVPACVVITRSVLHVYMSEASDMKSHIDVEAHFVRDAVIHSDQQLKHCRHFVGETRLVLYLQPRTIRTLFTHLSVVT
jgi:hypothetical protein